MIASDDMPLATLIDIFACQLSLIRIIDAITLIFAIFADTRATDIFRHFAITLRFRADY
jgi:hypothetical protein